MISFQFKNSYQFSFFGLINKIVAEYKNYTQLWLESLNKIVRVCAYLIMITTHHDDN